MKKDNSNQLFLSKFEELMLLAYFIEALNNLHHSMNKTAGKILENINNSK